MNEMYDLATGIYTVLAVLYYFVLCIHIRNVLYVMLWILFCLYPCVMLWGIRYLYYRRKRKG